MSLPSLPLGEIGLLNPPLNVATPSLEDEVDFFPMAAVDASRVSARASERRPYGEVRKGYTPFVDGDVLLAKITPCFENGKIAQAVVDTDCAFGSTEFHVIRPDPSRMDARYLVHFLRREQVRIDGERKMTGSGGQRRVPKHFLETLPIPVPSLAEQRRIAAILDQADALRAKRREALAQLDRLTQAVFIDMFGDPATNAMGWEWRSLGSIASKFSDGPFGSNLKSAHYTSHGVRVVRLQNIDVGRFEDKDKAYVSVEHFASIKKHECLPGDVLVATLGDPNLRACVLPSNIPLAINKADCVQIRVSPSAANAIFLVGLLNHPSTLKLASELLHGQTRVRISMGSLRGLRVPVPPVALQETFAARVTQVQGEQQELIESQAALDDLFASLQHRAFRGEL